MYSIFGGRVTFQFVEKIYHTQKCKYRFYNIEKNGFRIKTICEIAQQEKSYNLFKRQFIHFIQGENSVGGGLEKPQVHERQGQKTGAENERNCE